MKVSKLFFLVCDSKENFDFRHVGKSFCETEKLFGIGAWKLLDDKNVSFICHHVDKEKIKFSE